MLVPRFGELTAINNILGEIGDRQEGKKTTFTVEASQQFLSETVAPTSNTSYFQSSYLSLKSLSNF